MLIEVFKVDSDKPIKYGLTYNENKFNETLLQSCCVDSILNVECIVVSFFKNQRKQFTYWLTNNINNSINVFLLTEEDN